MWVCVYVCRRESQCVQIGESKYKVCGSSSYESCSKVFVLIKKSVIGLKKKNIKREMEDKMDGEYQII